jgi:hypothetical protein
MNITVTDEDIQAIKDVARATVRWPDHRRWDSSEKDARIKSLFGASSLIIAEIWHQIKDTISLEDPNAERKHMLWALVFLRVYATEEIYCAIVGWPNAETFRKYYWYFINKIFKLGEFPLIPARISKYITGTDRHSTVLTLDTSVQHAVSSEVPLFWLKF